MGKKTNSITDRKTLSLSPSLPLSLSLNHACCFKCFCNFRTHEVQKTKKPFWSSHSRSRYESGYPINNRVHSLQVNHLVSSSLYFLYQLDARESIQGNGSNIADSGRGKKKSNFSVAATFRGIRCTTGASQQVSVPVVIWMSADWQGKKARKKKHKRNSTKTCLRVLDDSGFASYFDFPDVWCAPGIGFSTNAATFVNYVVARMNVSSRGAA